MDINKLISRELDKKGEIKSLDIVKKTGFSRAYVDRFFKKLREDGIIILVGKANKASYVYAGEYGMAQGRDDVKKVHRILVNKNLDEDIILEGMKKASSIFKGLKKNLSRILEYAFTEMVNNAIEHSRSRKIEIFIERKKENIFFEIRDTGIGIFFNIMRKKRLNNDMEAIQDLLKGKETTAPVSHSGEGIFFTSKVGDSLTIKSSMKKLVFANLFEDVLIEDLKKSIKGTRVIFSIGLGSKKNLNEVFSEYTDDVFRFSKTKVAVKLYREGANYVSRSQARRLLSGLEKFKTIVLDFKDLDTVGQAFADEVFRVWKNKHKDKDIEIENAGENVNFMVKRALNA